MPSEFWLALRSGVVGNLVQYEWISALQLFSLTWLEPNTEAPRGFQGLRACTLIQIKSKTCDPVGIENKINTKPHLHTVRTQW